MKWLFCDDRPITNPESDVLGNAVDARRLARYVNDAPWPLTLGIYGEWGEGKTSFVHMLCHFLHCDLDSSIEVVEFSAWPYTSSESVWRALEHKLARKLYLGSADERPVHDPEPQDHGLIPALKRWFMGDALVFSSPTSTDDLREYERVVASLDRSAQVVLGGSRSQPDTGVLKASKLFAQTISSTPAGLGLTGKLVDFLSHKPPDAELPAIESVEQTSALLLKMFRDKGQQRRIVVFVDDLDRCLPEVGLEVLEALKIFLDKAPCLFIIAADEGLIGRGL